MKKDSPNIMMSISVLILTANRPDMLRTALLSVASQTALSNVVEVVVIENLGSRESEKVCFDFPQLPIKYLFRDPPIPPGYLSFQEALTHIYCDFVAILFDDDWWMDYHIEYAVAALEQNKNSTAFYAPWINVVGNNKHLINICGSFVPYFVASKPPVNNILTLDLADLLVASQIVSSFHMSSLVARRDTLIKSIECFADGNPFDTDRLIAVEFGKYGSVLCDQRPHAYVLVHMGSEGQRLTINKEGQKWWNKSNESLLLSAQKAGIDLKREFDIRMRSKKVDLEELNHHFYRKQFQFLIRRGILEIPGQIPIIQELYYLIKKMYRKLICFVKQSF